ncbi:hypothetical protein FCV25MIE_15427 [Fagus crenata]
MGRHNGPRHPHGPRQHRDVGVGGEKPRISVEVAVEAKGKSTYASVIGKGISAKSEHMVPPPQVPEFDRGSSISKSKSQTIPQNLAQSKARLPLCFFPNQNPPSQNRKFGKGLTITLNENGIRCVSWVSKAEPPTREVTRDKWVPKVQMVALNGLKESLVGSKFRPTFEKGETSGSVLTKDITGLTGPEVKLDKPKDITSNSRVDNSPEHDSPKTLALSLTSAASGGHVVTEGKATSHGEVVHHMGWFLQLNDGRRLVIPDFLTNRNR